MSPGPPGILDQRAGVVAWWLLGLILAAALGACGGEPEGPAPEAPTVAARATVAVAFPSRGALGLVDPARGLVASIPVGASPWGVAVVGSTAYVSTARHVAVVDLARARTVRRIAYRTPVGRPQVGEFRAGGMGIAVAAGGPTVYVGVNPTGGGDGYLERIDPRKGVVEGRARIGKRPFDVLLAADGRTVFTIDHDSYGVSAVDTRTLARRFMPVAPLGRGAFDKLNYGAIGSDGDLLLPINGEVLVQLDPRTGKTRTRSMRSEVHQAGVVRTGSRLLTVGAEALGSGRGPNLSIFDLRGGGERLVPLDRPHEDVAVSPDGGTAYLSGGYTRGGWRGITVVRLASGNTREIPLPGAPLGIATIRR